MTPPQMLSILSLDLSDRCELQVGFQRGQSILVVLTDGRQRFQGVMGGTAPLWSVLNGGKAAARSGRILIGLAREGKEIDVVAIQRGSGVPLASRFSAEEFGHLLERLELPIRTVSAETGSVVIAPRGRA